MVNVRVEWKYVLEGDSRTGVGVGKVESVDGQVKRGNGCRMELVVDKYVN